MVLQGEAPGITAALVVLTRLLTCCTVDMLYRRFQRCQCTLAECTLAVPKLLLSPAESPPVLFFWLFDRGLLHGTWDARLLIVQLVMIN